MSIFARFRQGPEERAAQAVLDEMPADQYRALGLERAESLSEAVWDARERDQAARRAPLRAIDDEERER